MIARLAADAVVVLHAAFVAFVMLGALLVLRRPGLIVAHIPAVAWGAFVEVTGRACPLTLIEKGLRARAGASGYGGGFVEHYLVPLLYPEGLTRTTQFALGAVVIAVNAAIYGAMLRRRRERTAVDQRAAGQV